MTSPDFIDRIIRIIERVDLAADRSINRNKAGEISPPGPEIEPQWLCYMTTISH